MDGITVSQWDYMFHGIVVNVVTGTVLLLEYGTLIEIPNCSSQAKLYNSFIPFIDIIICGNMLQNMSSAFGPRLQEINDKGYIT